MMIFFLQPLIPHYRKLFFEKFINYFDCTIFCYSNNLKYSNKFLNESEIVSLEVSSISFGPFLLYNPFVFLKSKCDTLVLMLHFGHVTTWILLLTKFIHRKKIVLWGHGISVKRYHSEEVNPSIFLKWMISLADLVWLYTEKEVNIWRNISIKSDHIISIDNTVSNVSNILSYKSDLSKDELKLKYSISERNIFIYCARFTIEERRADILLDIIKLSNSNIGFVVIGDGPFKPDFSQFSNVYEYGALYDEVIKRDLFSLSDVYIQPGWLGLSVVEAMSYGLPIFTMRRGVDIKQCVEYFYLEDSQAGMIFNSVNEFVDALNCLDHFELSSMSNKAKSYVSNRLLIDNMVNKAILSIKRLA